MPRFRWFLLALLVSILATFAPQTAQAQGTSGQLPDPMPTTADGDTLRLDLGPIAEHDVMLVRVTPHLS
mgnify:CR=1 FL=1